MALFSKFLVSRLAKLQPSPSAAHPDADSLTAFAENRLPARERETTLLHLSACSECREVLVLLFAATTETNDPPVRRANWRTFRWPAIAALAATCILVFTTVTRKPSTTVLTDSHVEKPKPMVQDATPVAPSVSPSRSTFKKKFASPPVIGPAVPSHSVNPPLLERAPVIATSTSIAQNLFPPPQPLESTALKADVANYAIAREMSGRALRQKSQQFKTFAGLATQKTLWTLDAGPGALRRSDNGGRTWLTVAVDGQTRIFAIAARGQSIWVGGDAAFLLHSSDNGVHWQRITVADGANTITPPIVAIDASRDGALRVKTASDVWLSPDGGLAWRRQ
jgi:hypothetical protein